MDSDSTGEFNDLPELLQRAAAGDQEALQGGGPGAGHHVGPRFFVGPSDHLGGAAAMGYEPPRAAYCRTIVWPVPYRVTRIGGYGSPTAVGKHGGCVIAALQ